MQEHDAHDDDAVRSVTAAGQAAVGKYLEPDERVLWCGRPDPRRAAWAGFPGHNWSARAGLLVLGALGLAPISAAGVYLAWTAADAFLGFASITAVLVSPLLFAVGLTLALAPWYVFARPRFRNAANARDTWYAITDRRVRVLLIRDGELADERATPLHCVTEPVLRFEHADGVGDVLDAQPRTVRVQEDDGSTWYHPGDIGFVGAPAAREVLALLERAVADCRAREEFAQ